MNNAANRDVRNQSPAAISGYWLDLEPFCWPIQEGNLPGPFKDIVKLKDARYGLLAATMLSVLAAPQWSAASDAASARTADGRIVVAQGPNDPNNLSKGKKGPP